MVAYDHVHGSSEHSRREDWLSDSLLSGFGATVALTAATAGAYGLANWLGDETGNRVEGWLYGLSHNGITDRTDDSLILAIGLNLLAGLGFAVIYGMVEYRLPGRHGWQKGMLFALVPWLLSITVFFSIMGVGVFGRELDAGPLAILGNLVLHLIYGAVLGTIYAIDLDAGLDGSIEDHLTALDIQRDTTIGLGAGALVGVIGGFVLRNQFDGVWANDLTIVVGGLVGAAFGGLIGSMMSEEHQDRGFRH